MSVQNGDVVILQIGGVQIGALVSNSQNMSADMLEKNSKDVPGIKAYDAGEYGWTLSVEALWDPAATEGFSEALGYLKAGTEITVVHGITGTSTQTGTGLISSIDVSGPKNEISSYTLEIQGTGEFTTGYGPELVVNGGFDSDTVWVKGSGVTITGGVAQCVSAGVNPMLRQTGIVAITTSYKVEFTISNYVSGGAIVNLGFVNGTTRTANGTYIENITTAAGTGLDINFNAGVFTGDIDNVSVKEIL
jgi:hypothetical protein